MDVAQPLSAVPQRILDKLVEVDGCWMWVGALTSNGYPVARMGGEKVLVHRIVWETTRGAIPTGWNVVHTCNERTCVYPNHLDLVPIRERSKRAYESRKDRPIKRRQKATRNQ